MSELLDEIAVPDGTPGRPQPDAELVEIYARLVGWLTKHQCIREDDENLVGTDLRAAKGFLQLVHPDAFIQQEKRRLLAATFPSRYDGMILSKHNLAFGMCPHHLLPVLYRISLAYIPQERVLGLSKLSRLAKLLARVPTLQEDLTARLCETLYVELASKGAAVYVEGLHLCMASRGVEAHEARVVTSEVRGVFRALPATRAEFLDLVTSSHPPLL